MLAMSQNPERVLTILRSSTCVTLDRGTRGRVDGSRTSWAAMVAVMAWFLLAGRWR